MTTHDEPLLPELRAYVDKMRARFSALKFYVGLVHLMAVSEIVSDLFEWVRGIGTDAHAARVSDDEAAAIMSTVLADKKVTADEIPLLETALRHVRRSADLDQRISEQATV